MRVAETSVSIPALLAQTHLARIAPQLVFGMVGVLVLLASGTLAAIALPRIKPGAAPTDLRQRMASWWVMAALVGAALVAGWPAVLGLFAVISFIALREFLSLAPVRAEDRPLIFVAYLTIPISYGLAAADRYGIYLVFIPVWIFLITPFLMAVIGQTRSYLPRAAVFHWGMMTCVYNLGFAAYLSRAPAAAAPEAGGAGLVFFLLLATEANDVAQYVWGKLIGRRKVLPRVSPNKTWEGFIGGWATTAILIWILGPFFVPLRGVGLGALAAALPLAGFAGDVTMSAVKRDIGVKDTSHLIPGHGGVLDRVDSLTFTAPLYFHLMVFFCMGRPAPWP
ncbi:MAG TPA: phosphatidate cytidylyltransferase [Caulobacteraceae bacterium]|nr:phosphatidate cytidylyltransferase [Caulobacteraceae bacterium]